MKTIRRALLILIAALTFAAGSAHAEKLCASGGVTYPMPNGHPATVSVGPYCAPVP